MKPSRRSWSSVFNDRPFPNRFLIDLWRSAEICASHSHRRCLAQGYVFELCRPWLLSDRYFPACAIGALHETSEDHINTDIHTRSTHCHNKQQTTSLALSAYTNCHIHFQFQQPQNQRGSFVNTKRILIRLADRLREIVTHAITCAHLLRISHFFVVLERNLLILFWGA